MSDFLYLGGGIDLAIIMKLPFKKYFDAKIQYLALKYTILCEYNRI